MNQTGWDFIITGTVLIGLVLFLWAKVSNQTIPELIRSIKEIFQDKGEEAYENAMTLTE